MSNTLKIYDASYVVYVGTNSEKYNSKVEYGVCYGGLHKLCESVFYFLSQNYDVAVVMDSYTDKKDKYEEYKSNRVSDAGVRIQLEIIEEWFKKIGIQVIKKHNYEADDLIAKLVDDYINIYPKIDIYTGDADVYANIRHKGVTVYGCSKQSPTVDYSNYMTVAKKGAIIPWNSILPYFMIYGKKSNNMGPLKLESCKNHEILFKDFIGYLNSRGVEPGERSLKKHALSWRFSKFGKIPKEDFEEIKRQIDMTYPKEVPDSDDFKIRTVDLDKEAMAEFFALFGLNMSAMNMGMYQSVKDSRNTGKRIEMLKMYHNRMHTLYTKEYTGEVHLQEDCDVDYDEDFEHSFITTDSFR